MAKVDITKDVLTKLTSVFPDDLILYKNLIVMPGPATWDKTRGEFLCILQPEVKEAFDTLFGVDAITTITSIRDAKKSLDSAIGEPTLDDETRIDKYKEIYEYARKIDEWDDMTEILSEEDISRVFDYGQRATIFEETPYLPTLVIGKNLFPLVKRTNIDRLLYSTPMKEKADEGIKETESTWRIVFKFTHDYFEAYYTYRILEIHNNGVEA